MWACRAGVQGAQRGVRGGWKGMALTEGVERDRGMTHGGLELGLEHR